MSDRFDSAFEGRGKRDDIVPEAIRSFVKILKSAFLRARSWRYMMLVRRQLAHFPIGSARDFSAFAATMYPGLREDELNAFSISFAGHCVDPPSSATAAEFICGRLLGKDEPRLRKWLKILKCARRLGRRPTASDGRPPGLTARV